MSFGQQARLISMDGGTERSEVSSIVAAAVAGDESSFAALVERYRRELHIHCYRMLGSFEEAEDRVQETFLRAWSKRATFEARSSYRAWLYRIATNACLEILRRKSHRPRPVADESGRVPPYSDMPWLQPYPDALLNAATTDDAPEPLLVAKETIELSFLAVIQLLPPKQRAVLILRDVLDFSAAESASLLDATIPAVNSALQRARATLQKHQGSRDRASIRPTVTEEERALVQRYIDAHEQADPEAVIALLREDARMTISPMGLCWEGRDNIEPDFREGMNALGVFRCLPTRANRQPAVAHYLRRWDDSEYRAWTITVFRIEGGALLDLTTFARPELFAAFGLPPTA
jgi:RNA polymerase sigma-70 factor (ECF subfamily)